MVVGCKRLLANMADISYFGGLEYTGNPASTGYIGATICPVPNDRRRLCHPEKGDDDIGRAPARCAVVISRSEAYNLLNVQCSRRVKLYRPNCSCWDPGRMRMQGRAAIGNCRFDGGTNVHLLVGSSLR